MEKESEAERIVRLEVTVQNLHQHFISHDKEEMEWRISHDKTMREFTDKLEESVQEQKQWKYGWKGALLILGAIWVLISGGLEKAGLVIKKIFLP